jgi:cyanophycin synthetase
MHAHSEKSAAAPAIGFFDVRRITAVGGAANGLRVPSVRLLLSLAAEGERSGEALHRGARALGLALGVPDAQPADAAGTLVAPLISALCQLWTKALSSALTEVNAALAQTVSGPPSQQGVEIAKAGGAQKAAGILLQWPTHWPHLLGPVLNWALDQWSMLAQAADKDAAVQAVRSSWEQLKPRIRQALPPGANPARLLTAASDLKLPIRWIDRDIMQVGHGRRARWLCSTLTDSTPSLGTMLARDKASANRLLRAAGIPVPQHVEVTSEEAALAAAERLGWPVVVKPADQDQGTGARPNLHSVKQVIAAYRHASAISKRVLVEKHVAGNEYRLGVVHGRLFWAHERVPAKVTGDGQSTLQALIDAENDRRGVARMSDVNAWSPIELNGESLDYLIENGFSLDGVPALGAVVQLQRVPNGSGSTGRHCLNAVHPDNRLLAERVAKLLRLDVAGVDIIISDISWSWRDAGGAVTEVNAVPRVSNRTDPNVVVRLLSELIPAQGRIPLCFVLAPDEAAIAWVEVLHARLSATGLRTGLSTEAGLRIGTDWIRMGRSSLWDDVQALQMDPTVGAIVVVGDDAGFLQSGLPFDAVDALIVATHAPQVLQLLMPYSGSFKAVIGDHVTKQYGDALQAWGGNWLALPRGEQGERRLVDETVRALLAAEAAYAHVEPVLQDEVSHAMRS